jgi:glycerate kinase
MKVVAAPNAFKGSLSAFEAAAAMAIGIRRALPKAEVVELPVADGGDGTTEVLCRARQGQFREAPAVDALGRPLRARYGWLSDATAVMDVATASGLARLRPSELEPLSATSFGTGQLLKAALDAGARRVVLGVGGSASVDGGAGVLEALGARLLDEQGRQLARGGGALAHLTRIDTTRLHPRARSVPLDIACDVDSPLLGEHGAARTFGPQKGATPAMVEQLELGLGRMSEILRRDFGRDVACVRSGGAAGGIAAGLCAVLDARLVSGIDLVLDTIGFEQALAGAELCLTGEGRLDQQSLHDKGPLGVARRARACGVQVVLLAGEIAENVALSAFPDLSAMFALRPRALPLAEAMTHAGQLLEAAVERAVRQALAR